MAEYQTIHILDSGVFLTGAEQRFMEFPCATIYNVVDEMKSSKASIEMDRCLQSGLAVLEPSKESIEAAEKARQKTQDKLSKTDIRLIALALDFKKKKKEYVLITDDYGIQNLSRKLKVNYAPMSREGIKKEIEWTGRCRACGFKTNQKICPDCGSAVKFGARVVK